jgi:S1-C subfamily serine protease
VRTGEDVQREVRSVKIGDTVTLTLQRGREIIEVPVTTGQMPKGRFEE